MWTGFLITAHYVVATLIGVRVLLRPRMEPYLRLTWILLIEALPVIGALSYLLFGEIRQGRAEIERMRHVRDRLTGLWRPAPEAVADPPEHAAPVIDALRATSGFGAVAGNRAGLLAEDDSAMDDLARAIDAARDHVHLLFYIWLPDATGSRVAEAAIRAAERGVTVRVIVDAIGSRAFIRSEPWGRLQAAGAQVVEAFPLGYFPLVSALFQRVDLRNHRKVAVIDNAVAFTGSRNCSDMAFAVKARFAPWIDVFLRIEGPVVRQMQAVFLQDWMSYTTEDLGDMLVMVPPAGDPGQIAQVVATGPDWREGSMSDCLTTLIYAARDSLTIATPYYVPDAALDTAIRSAARRGVRVTLILPERNDSLVVAATSEGFYYGLLAAGVRIQLFQSGLLHSKIMTADGRMAMIGSANLDRRSFELNYENNVLFVCEDLTEALDLRAASYVARGRELTLDEVRGWSVLRRMRNNLLALAAPLL